GELRHVGQPEHRDARQSLVGEDTSQLGQLVRVAGGQYQPGPFAHFDFAAFFCARPDGLAGGSGNSPGYGSARAAAWIRLSSAQPASAMSNIASSVDRVNVAPSAVPCTSMSVPESVATTFMSTSARESSSY